MDLWLKQCWCACCQLDILITTKIVNFLATGHGNIKLIQALIQHGIKGTELVAFNQCKLFLQVIYLSDICCGGTKITILGWSEIPAKQGWGSYQWPTAVWPTVQNWVTWQQYLRGTFSLSCNQQLAIPLGLRGGETFQRQLVPGHNWTIFVFSLGDWIICACKEMVWALLSFRKLQSNQQADTKKELWKGNHMYPWDDHHGWKLSWIQNA